MNYEDFKASIFYLFAKESEYSKTELKFENLGESSVDIWYTCMYENPVDNLFEFGLKLVELFGTKSIDFDDVIYSGCETCDYGSEYGHTFNIKNITKNMDNLKQFCREYGSKNVYTK